MLEGQVIQLEDGTTAYIHQVTVQKGESTARYPCLMEGGQAFPTEGLLPGTKLQRKAGIALITEPLSFEDGQPVQLEDGSMAYIHRTPKGGVIVIITGRKEGRQNRQNVYPGSWGVDVEAVVPNLT